MYVGTQVEVGGVNERIAAANEAQLEVLRQIADDMRNIKDGFPSWMAKDIAAQDPDDPMPITTVRGRRGSAIWTH